MGIEEESLAQLRALNQNITSLNRSFGKMTDQPSFGQASRAPTRDEFDTAKKARRGSKQADVQAKAVTSYNTAAKKFMKVSGNLSSEIADANDDLKTLRNSWREGSESMFDMKERIDKWGDSTTALNSQATKIVAGMSRFTDNLAKTTKAQSLLYSEQLTFINGFKNFEKAAYFDELSKSLGSLSKTTKERLKLVDESTGALRADLDVSDFKRVRATIGELESSFKEVLSGTDFKSFSDLLRNGRFNEAPGDNRSDRDATDSAIGNDKASVNRDAVVKIAAILQSQGMYRPSNDKLSVLDANGNLKNAAELNKIDFTRLTAQISTLEQSFGRASQNLDRNVDIFNDKWSRFIRSIQNAEGRAASIDSLKELTANFLSSGAALKFAKDKIIKAYEEMSAFNIAQIPATYFEVNKASMSLGLSFKDTVKLMDENKRILAIYGPEKFQTAMGTMSKTFQKYGYTLEQAATMIGPTVESAISAGINVRDPGELNKFTESMMGSFQQLSGMVKISAQEFATLNKSLFTSEGAFDIMLGLDTQRRQAYAQDLVQLRTKYVQQGLEIRQAQELIQAQQQQQRGRLKDRQEDAAKLLTSAQLAGLGNDAAMEAFRLASKGRRTESEQARLTELAGQINQGIERRTNEGYGSSGSGAMGDILNDLRQDLQPSAALGQITKAGSQMQVAKEAGAQVTDTEKAAASAAAKGNETVAQLGNAVNKVSAVLNNAFLGGLVGSTVALVAFGFQLSKLSMLMGGKGGILGSLMELGKGALSKAGGAAGSAAGGVSRAAGGLAQGVRGVGSGFAGAAGKIVAGAGTALLAFDAFSDINDAAAQKKAGTISDKQASVKSAGAVAGLAAGGTASIIGAGIGQVLIPIPGVGAIVGGAVGAALGGWLGKTGGEAVANAVISDDKPATQTKPQVVPSTTPTDSKTAKSTDNKPVDSMAKSIAQGISLSTPSLAAAIAEAVKNAFISSGVTQPSKVANGGNLWAPEFSALSSFVSTGAVATPVMRSIMTSLSPLANGIGTLFDPTPSIMTSFAKPTQSQVMPIQPMTSRIVDSSRDDIPAGINTLAQDGSTVVGVQDTDSNAKLQEIATSMVMAVDFLRRLAEQQPAIPNQNTARTTAAPPNNMNQIPSAYQFTTGRMG